MSLEIRKLASASNTDNNNTLVGKKSEQTHCLRKWQELYTISSHHLSHTIFLYTGHCRGLWELTVDRSPLSTQFVLLRPGAVKKWYPDPFLFFSQRSINLFGCPFNHSSPPLSLISLLLLFFLFFPIYLHPPALSCLLFLSAVHQLSPRADGATPTLGHAINWSFNLAINMSLGCVSKKKRQISIWKVKEKEEPGMTLCSSLLILRARLGK